MAKAKPARVTTNAKPPIPELKAKSPYADDDRSVDAEMWRMEQEHIEMHARQARGEPPK